MVLKFGPTFSVGNHTLCFVGRRSNVVVALVANALQSILELILQIAEEVVCI